MNALGSDVSYWNGPNQQYPRGVDWRIAHEQGSLVFGFARACAGRYYTDSTFAANWDGMKAAGVLRGAYLYFYAEQDAEAQAEKLFSLSKGEGELPDVIDVEEDRGLSPAQLRERVKRCLDRYEQLAGRKAIIYTRASFWNPAIGNAGWESNYPLWVAHYYATTPLLPQGWQGVGWKFWQDSPQENFPGFQDPTADRNYYNGTAAELRQWLGLEPPPPTLEQRVADLERRVAALEKIAHSH